MTEKQAIKVSIKLRDATKLIKMAGGVEVPFHPHMVSVWSRRGNYIVVVHWPFIKEPEVYQ